MICILGIFVCAKKPKKSGGHVNITIYFGVIRRLNCFFLFFFFTLTVACSLLLLPCITSSECFSLLFLLLSCFLSLPCFTYVLSIRPCAVFSIYLFVMFSLITMLYIFVLMYYLFVLVLLLVLSIRPCITSSEIDAYAHLFYFKKRKILMK